MTFPRGSTSQICSCKASAEAAGRASNTGFGLAWPARTTTVPEYSASKSGVTARNVRLPAGTDWRNGWTGEVQAGGQTVKVAAPLDRPPFFVRLGGGPSFESGL